MTDAEIDAAIASLRTACAMRDAGYSTPATDVTCALLLKCDRLADMVRELEMALRDLLVICRPGGERSDARRRYDAARAALAKAERR